MSLYPAYLKEREGVDTLEREDGFATYKLRDGDCYIIDIYVVPEKRRSGLASQMANEIASLAKSKGYKFITGSVDLRVPSAPQSAATLVAYGMKPVKQEEHMIWFVKEIK